MKKKEKSIKLNFFLNSLLTVSNVVIPLITFPYIARVLLVEANGKVTFATSIINYFIMFSALGIPTYGIRACAQVRDDKFKLSKTVHELLTINVIMTVISYLAFVILIFSNAKVYQEKTLYIINSLSLLLNAFGINWLYSALEEYKYITIRSVVFKIIAVIAMFALIHEPKDYLLYSLVLVFSTVGSNVLNMFYARKFVHFSFLGEYNFLKHIRPILLFFATTVSISIYTNLDIVMLGFISGDVEVGYYGAAVKIRSTLATLEVSLGTVLLPRLSYMIQKKQFKEFLLILEKAFHFIFLTAIPITIYFITYADISITFFAGVSYLDAVKVTQILIPTVFIAGLSNVTGTQIMVPLGKENYLLYSIIGGAVTDFILNCFLIKPYGSSGAALATTIAEIVVLSIQLWFLKDYLKTMNFAGKSIKPVCASFMSISFTIFIMKYINMGLLGQLTVSFTVFWGIYFCLLFIFRDTLVLNVLSTTIESVKKLLKNR